MVTPCPEVELPLSALVGATTRLWLSHVCSLQLWRDRAPRPRDRSLLLALKIRRNADGSFYTPGILTRNAGKQLHIKQS
ncbi:unnamed protein product [Arctogadus glacialis]